MEFILESGGAGSGEGGWSANLRHPAGRVSRLEMEWPGDRGPAPAVLDGLTIAVLPTVMRAGGALRVRGPITRGALRNLTEFAEAWASWRPGSFRRVFITADRILDESLGVGAEAVAAWSGSLRSTHTLVRHIDSLVPGPFRIRAVVHIRGLRRDENDGEAVRVFEAARLALEPESIALIGIRTNAAAAGLIDAEIGSLPIVAAALHAVGGRAAGTGVHGRGWHFAAQRRYPRPGPALPDLFSGDRFAIRADGGTASPPVMAEDVSRHPALAEIVSDCRSRPSGAPACGRCPGCTLLALAFLAARRRPPRSLRRARVTCAATFPFRDPVLAADADATLAHWGGARGLLRPALALRSAGARLGNAIRDNLRWLGSAAGLIPPWPR